LISALNNEQQKPPVQWERPTTTKTQRGVVNGRVKMQSYLDNGRKTPTGRVMPPDVFSPVGRPMPQVGQGKVNE